MIFRILYDYDDKLVGKVMEKKWSIDFTFIKFWKWFFKKIIIKELQIGWEIIVMSD